MVSAPSVPANIGGVPVRSVISSDLVSALNLREAILARLRTESISAVLLARRVHGDYQRAAKQCSWKLERHATREPKRHPSTFGILKEDTSETSPMRQVFLAVPSKTSTFGILIEKTFHINRPPKVVSFSKGPSQPHGFSRSKQACMLACFSPRRRPWPSSYLCNPYLASETAGRPLGACARPLPLCVSWT